MSPLCLDHPETFARLYACEAGRVLRYCRGRIGQEQDAEDVAGSVWLRAFEHRRNVRGMFRAWLFRIAHNAVVDYYRRHRSAVPLDMVMDVGGDEWPQVEARLDCEAALSAVDERARRILVGHWLAGMTSRELGVELGMAAGAVRSMELRTLTRLRKEFVV